MNSWAFRLSTWLAIFLLQFTFIGCAMGQKMVFHDFSFDPQESPDVEVLDWQYGAKDGEYESSNQKPLRARKELVDAGRPVPAALYGGVMPVGDFLYVKWRLKKTGDVHEDRVDLANRLPRDMKYYALHFVVKSDQLYVYLIPPTPPHTPPFNSPDIGPAGWSSGLYYQAEVRKDQSAASYLSEHQIYPSK